jgi:chromosome segregation ATPase
VQLTAEILENLQTDESIHKIIAKIFTLQRGYESELSEVKHKIKMQQMQIEESENLKFDIEILNDEKSMLEGDISQLRNTIGTLESRLAEAQHSMGEVRTQNEALLRQVKESYERAMQRDRIEHESALNA